MFSLFFIVDKESCCFHSTQGFDVVIQRITLSVLKVVKETYDAHLQIYSIGQGGHVGVTTLETAVADGQKDPVMVSPRPRTVPHVVGYKGYTTGPCEGLSSQENRKWYVFIGV